MQLKERVAQNIAAQKKLAKTMDDLRSSFEQANIEMTRLSGAMSVLSELYNEEFGQDLQQAINTDPEFKKMIDQELNETPNIKKIPAPAPAAPVLSMTPPVPPSPKRQMVAGNKKIEPPAVPSEEQAAVRSRPPVKVVINDGPPPGPGDSDDD